MTYNLREYMVVASRTAIHPNELPEDGHENLVGLLYCATKLCGEAGEVSEVIGKALRDAGGKFDDERKANLMLEMGDTIWYLMRICKLLNIDPEEVLHMNIDKLNSRKQRDALHGDGDKR